MFFNRVPHYHGKGKVVVVSGCDHGMGNAAVKKLSSLGYIVIAGCLTDEGASKLRVEVTGIRAEKCDVTKTEDVARLVSIVESEYNGKLHALVNNAGIMSAGHALTIPMEASEQMVTVNLLGTMRMTKMFLPLLVDNAGSRIVFMSSVCGVCPVWGAASYCASKFGVEGYARVLRDELQVFDVQVSTINPAATNTNLMQTFIQSTRDNFEACPEGTKKVFGPDYGQRCLEHFEETLTPVLDDISVPTDCICKAVGSISSGDRHYSGFLAKTKFRMAAIFPALSSYLNRTTATAILPNPEEE